MEESSYLAHSLVQRIGEGGTGVVYRSFDRELEDWVAVKLLRGERLARESSRTSLRRVVKLARRVAHRNVARVFEFGRLGGTEVVLERVGGPDEPFPAPATGPTTDAEES